MNAPAIFPCVNDPACNADYNGHSAHCLRSYGDGIRAEAKVEERETCVKELMDLQDEMDGKWSTEKQSGLTSAYAILRACGEKLTHKPLAVVLDEEWDDQTVNEQRAKARARRNGLKENK